MGTMLEKANLEKGSNINIILLGCGALAASKTFIEALIKLSRQGQNEPGPEIGSALGEVADFQAEVHTQQVELLRIFYAEFLTPLESNVEKDERILNTEYRRFVNENQLHLGAIQRAASRVKKERKKMKGSSATLDREHKDGRGRSPKKRLQTVSPTVEEFVSHCEIPCKVLQTWEIWKSVFRSSHLILNAGATSYRPSRDKSTFECLNLSADQMDGNKVAVEDLHSAAWDENAFEGD
ncbi:unnamed protein product [Cyprideis torosa]|uniref:Uncharacterized protein n=1 Tax=Cyprideis torosa TaxID=163714 RepID=A0A7R8ZPF8_9CRUS|nr:unnamed protein product [Cyprideis torosa]CAG0893835.1 unnamed protein product [Cyprideis torosa]